MKVKLAVILVLAALTVAYRGMAAYMRYFSPDLQTRSPFETEYKKGALTVARVETPCPQPKEKQVACSNHPHPGDRIVEIYDGKGQGGAVTGGFTYGAYLRPIGSRESWKMVVDRPLPDGTLKRMPLQMAPAIPLRWSVREWLTNLGFDVYLPLLAMSAGLFIGVLRPDNRQAFQAAVVFLGFSAVFGTDVSQFPAGWREMGLILRVTAGIFSPFLILRFFLEFPRRSVIVRKLPWLVPACFAIASVVWGVGLTLQTAASYSFRAYERIVEILGAGRVTGHALAYVGTAPGAGMILLALVALALNTARAGSRDDRRRLILISIGAVGGLFPCLILFLWPSKVPTAVLLITLPLIGLFPITFVSAVVRHRIFGIRLILRQGLQYALLSRGFLVVEGAVIFLALYFAVGPLLVRYVPDSAQSVASVGIAAVTLGLVFGTQRVNRRIMPVIDRRFFREAYDAQQILTALVKALRQLASRPDLLLQKVVDEISVAFHPDHVAVFLTEEPWPHLSPVTGPDAACWIACAPQRTGARYALYVHRARALPGVQGGWREKLAPEPVRYSRTPVARLLEGCVEGEPEILDVFLAAGPRAPRDEEQPPSPCLEDTEMFARFDARIVVPLATQGRALGFLLLGQKRSEEHYARQDRELLLAVAEQVSIALDYSRMIEGVAEQQKLEREIQIAQDVQAKLFPQDRPVLRTLRCAGTCRTARGVGGDYFDFLQLGPDRLGIAVADIAGKGLSAALLMASLQALVRSHAPANAHGLDGFAGEINRHLCDSTDDARFATLFFGVYDDATRRLRYVNAGHNPPILLRQPGGAGDRVRRLLPTGTILGCFPERSWQEQVVDLAPGDLLVVFSDGIVEATNAADEQFSDPRLVSLVERSAHLGEDALAALVMEEVGRFLGGVPPQDDMTLIVAGVR
ncbi:MAG: SpoIIE family protein phosphatase [Acidobacteriia bacterium]|nr:SpoIIE family protein phosphatase [Terriglobia bacterium]